MAAILILAGCATHTTVTAPASTIDNVSVTIEQPGFFSDGEEPYTYFQSVTDASGKPAVEDKVFSGIPNPLNLAPGTYEFVIKCTNSPPGMNGVYNLTRLRVHFDKPDSYVAYCVFRTEKGFLGMEKITAMKPFISPKNQLDKERAANKKAFQSQH